MKQRRLQSSLADLLIIVMIFTACGGTGGGGGGGGSVTPSARVTYSPPFLPIDISYDFFSNKLSVSLSSKIQTPLGAFKISGGAVIDQGLYLAAEKKYQSARKLRIEAGDTLHIYKLEDGKQYSIKIPTDVYGESKVETSGTDGDIVISIPHPTDETIAGLRARNDSLAGQLRELRAREEAQAQSAAQENDAPSRGAPAPYAGASDAPPTPSPEYVPPPPAAETRRGFGGLYEGSAGFADIREAGGNEFSFVLSTPRCSREAIGRARWTSAGAASSLPRVREDAARMENAAPAETGCVLSFKFSGGGLVVEEVGDTCLCNYAGLYSLD
jgi:hypothetical protein